MVFKEFRVIIKCSENIVEPTKYLLKSRINGVNWSDMIQAVLNDFPVTVEVEGDYFFNSEEDNGKDDKKAG